MLSNQTGFETFLSKNIIPFPVFGLLIKNYCLIKENLESEMFKKAH